MKRRELAAKVAMAYAAFEAEHPAGTNLAELDRRFAFNIAEPYIRRGDYRPRGPLAFNYARLAAEARHPRHLARARRDIAFGIAEGMFADDPYGPRFPRNADGTAYGPPTDGDELERWRCPTCGARAGRIDMEAGAISMVSDTAAGRALLRAGLEPQPWDAHREVVTRNYRLECAEGHVLEWEAAAAPSG